MLRLSVGGFGLPQTITRGLGLEVIFWPETFWAALVTYLKGAASLSSLKGVYLRSAPPGYSLPCLIYTPLDDLPTLNTSETYWEESTVQFTILANDDVTAETLGQAAYQVLSPWTLDNGTRYLRPKLRALDGYEMGAVMGRQLRAMLVGRGPRNRNVWAVHFKVTFLVGRSMTSGGS